MPSIPQRDLRGKHPIDTFPHFVLIDNTGSLFDGTGSQIVNIDVSCSYASSASYEIVYETSSSFADWAASASFTTSASWASSSISASYAPVEPNYSSSVSTQFGTKQDSLVTGDTYTITSSWAGNAVSASWALFTDTGTTLVTGSTYEVTSSWADNSKSSSYVSASNVLGGLTQEIYFVSESFTTMSFVNGILTTVI